MPVIGVTGGVATGKTTAASQLRGQLSDGQPAEYFSADECAGRLCKESLVVQGKIADAFGSEVFSAPGELDKQHLRSLIFGDPGKRQILEDILHPMIRQEWTSRAEKLRGSGQYLIAEIPLLYETQAEGWFDHIIVVAASRRRQLQRLAEKRGWTRETATHAIEAQMPLADKIRRADTLIWNDHTETLLERQVHCAAARLKICYA